MAEIQDEDQWLYGDDKEEPNAGKREAATNSGTDDVNKNIDKEDNTTVNQDAVPSSEVPETNGETLIPVEKSAINGEEKKDDKADGSGEKGEERGEKEGGEKEGGEKEVGEKKGGEKEGGEKEGGDEDDTSDSDNEPTVTIGKIVKQPDIMRPPPPTHRAAPTSGLKEEDFSTAGRINGAPVADFNLADLEDKPWRKPGADLSDYFNYGFTEDTWIRYCERQKQIRTNESGTGLNSLGINVAKNMLGSSNIPVSIVNENSKYGGLRKGAGLPLQKGGNNSGQGDENHPGGGGNMGAGGQQHQGGGNAVNTIQVMTADRRTYSNKVLSGVGGPPGSYEEMDFGGSPYGSDFFSTPPPNFFGPPPGGPWGGGVPNVPPPGWTPEGPLGPPPPMPHHRGGGGMGYFEEDPAFGSRSRSAKEEREMEKIREAIAESRDRDRESTRHHSSRRRSRSRSKSRHKRRTSRSKSRSRSPSSHKHKRKKSKRERETD